MWPMNKYLLVERTMERMRECMKYEMASPASKVISKGHL